jgi:hypothetical protein
MKTNLKIIISVFFAFILLGGTSLVSAQNMSHTVVEKEVKFARGKNSATYNGQAKYAMSYVYNLTAKKGQKMQIKLTGNNPELKFSLILPDEETMDDGFAVTDWTGTLPQSGKYSIVVVMNDENASRVPYKLWIKIN